MSKINIKKTKNVECYDFESKTNIPYDGIVEVKNTVFINNKIKEGILEEVTAKGGVKNDSGKGGKSKKKI